MDATTVIKAALAAACTPLGPKNTAIAGHAIRHNPRLLNT